MSSYFALVRFTDGNTPFVVKSEEIKSFSPVHSGDYDAKKLYDVLWQNGTESFDGYFKASITCMAGEYCTVYVFYGKSKYPPTPKGVSISRTRQTSYRF